MGEGEAVHHDGQLAEILLDLGEDLSHRVVRADVALEGLGALQLAGQLLYTGPEPLVLVGNGHGHAGLAQNPGDAPGDAPVIADAENDAVFPRQVYGIHTPPATTIPSVFLLVTPTPTRGEP